MKISIRNLQKHYPLDLRRVRRAARKVLASLELSNAELSILLVDDARIRELNRQYLNRNRPTNVIAFPMKEGEFSILNPQLLGDLVISVDTARRQAPRFGLNHMETVLFLMIHGLLHLVGYEHEGTRKGARKMARKQKELLSRILEE
ncbi:MAG: rRNA maturation RNase YbeY [Deltaproteobacteria bacterium]|nr:MAG: rRNA maturation RNase YbeY [Deltaproteobacteria bacterium]